ncbi:MAG TPA: DUF3224 domain-containing protein, partial [Candidatus Didemnitutus sp.]|nr:DUF3224 domain-containing protein [Candidatus Didemnitutus sp.]
VCYIAGMKHLLLAIATLTSAIALCSADTPANPIPKETRMKTKANGTFDVKMLPQPAGEKTGDAVGRFALDKQYRGDLEASSLGEMLAALTAVKGSAGYVAIEKVTGKLGGRSGTFCLQHSGLMARGEGNMSVVVIPDSGTGELTGLVGVMTIKIAPDGSHSYEFDYSVPNKS